MLAQILRVYLEDESTLSISISPTATADELRQALSAKLSLRSDQPNLDEGFLLLGLCGAELPEREIEPHETVDCIRSDHWLLYDVALEDDEDQFQGSFAAAAQLAAGNESERAGVAKAREDRAEWRAEETERKSNRAEGVGQSFRDRFKAKHDRATGSPLGQRQ